ncbi:MAG TPA: ribosomal protein S18-alanine N-acetyltransferase, partial [Leptolyngbyaceae cyanobacterium]
HPPTCPSPHPPILGLGCLWAILEEAHITIVAVHPNYRRQGLGQALLLYLLSSAKQRGLERATLEVKVSNQAALSMYEKYGFRVAGRRRGYYQDTGEDALILWLSGIQYPEFAKNLARWSKQIQFCLTSFGWDLHCQLIHQ